MENQNKKVTAWIIKYALTKGLIKCEGTLSNDSFYPSNPHQKNFLFSWFRPYEYVLSEEEAKAFFYDKKKLQIASLHESINKLENMTEPTIKEY